MSKGSTPRPIIVSNQEYSQRWDAIFGKDNPVEKTATDDTVQPVTVETKEE